MRKLFWKSLVIPNVSARKSDFLACCTVGALESKTENSPACPSFPPADGRPITPSGFPHPNGSFFPMSCCVLTVSLDEFLRRFLWHVLPKGFVRIRHFGFLANRKRATNLPLCFQLLGCRRCGVIA